MNQSCLSFGFIKGTLSIFNPWHGGWPSRMLEGLSYHNQYRKGRGRGNPRGSAPLCRGARDLLVPGVSFAAFMLLLSSTRESRPGHGAERPYKGGVQRRAPALLAGGVQRAPTPSQKTNPGTSRWGNGRSRSAKSLPASAASWERFPPESAPRQTPPDNS